MGESSTHPDEPYGHATLHRTLPRAHGSCAGLTAIPGGRWGEPQRLESLKDIEEYVGQP